ncbi:MAG: DUF3108 domain-containing protein [Oleiphilaceae bacterium]|nr:DUF3108 domain-containing protein [Oleiphilaceae bacterium]
MTEQQAGEEVGEEATAPPELTPFTATYKASIDKGVAIKGKATRTLKQNPDGTWHLSFNVESVIADIEESLQFQWQDARILPLAYRYKLSGFLIGERKRVLDYDWQEKTVSGRYEKKSFSMALPDGALDPLGYQLQLRQDLKAGKKRMAYQVTDKGDFDQDEFAVIGEETLTTALGKVKTIKAEKVRDPAKKRETLLWFAPDRDYLLVKLVQIESNGTRYEINIDDADIHQGG